jgi:hypothetical protein
MYVLIYIYESTVCIHIKHTHTHIYAHMYMYVLIYIYESTVCIHIKTILTVDLHRKLIPSFVYA